VPEVRQARAGRQPDVTGSYNPYLEVLDGHQAS
jgi:hypothetical protein